MSRTKYLLNFIYNSFRKLSVTWKDAGCAKPDAAFAKLYAALRDARNAIYDAWRMRYSKQHGTAVTDGRRVSPDVWSPGVWVGGNHMAMEFWLCGVSAGDVSFFAFLDTLPVTRGDALLFRSRHPVLIAKALARILHGSSSRASATFLILAVCLSVAWVVVCGLGRAATMRAIFAHFRSLTALGVAREEVATFSASSLFGLNFFRVIALLAACAAGFAPLAMAHWVRSDDPSLVFVLFMAVAILIFAAWSAVNWFLSAAVLFVVGDGENTFGAMAATIDLCRNRPGPISAIGAWFGLAHLGAFAIATFAAMLSVGTLGVLPVRLVVLGMISVSLVYFAVADFLYIGRMAAYAAVVEIAELACT